MKKTKLQKLKEKATRLAMDKKLEENPYCPCGKPATVAHHLVRQKNSNYLRTKQYNMIACCAECHLKAHSRGDIVAFGEIPRADRLKRESSILIQDSMGYWQNIIDEYENNN